MPHNIIKDTLKDVSEGPPIENFIKEQQRTNKLLEEILKKLSEIEHHKK